MGALGSVSKSTASLGLHISEVVLLAFGLLLAVGLVGEYTKSDKWKEYARLCELMVIVGVLGELIGDGGMFLFSEALQSVSDLEVAQLNVKAAGAEQKAAEERERAAQAEARAAEANEKAEQERSARMAIEEQLAHRVLSEEQKKSIASKLTQFAGIVVGVIACTNDLEIREFATQIRDALAAAGMTPLIALDFQGIALTGVGVFLPRDRLQVEYSAAVGINEALKAEKVKLVPGPLLRNLDTGWFVTPEEIGDVPIWVVVGARS